jgi:hypothetical protein
LIVDTVVDRLRVEDLLPPVVLRRVRAVDRLAFFDDVKRYVAMDDDDLLRATRVCLRNLGRLDDHVPGPDVDLRGVLVPELWERLRSGTRNDLRRLSCTLAEYNPDSARPSIFARYLSPETLASLHVAADELRRRIESTALLDVGALIEQVRFAIAGSRAVDWWSPADPVYEPGFTYRLVPAVAWRVLVRARVCSGIASSAEEGSR